MLRVKRRHQLRGDPRRVPENRTSICHFSQQGGKDPISIADPELRVLWLDCEQDFRFLHHELRRIRDLRRGTTSNLLEHDRRERLHALHQLSRRPVHVDGVHPHGQRGVPVLRCWNLFRQHGQLLLCGLSGWNVLNSSRCYYVRHLSAVFCWNLFHWHWIAGQCILHSLLGWDVLNSSWSYCFRHLPAVFCWNLFHWCWVAGQRGVYRLQRWNLCNGDWPDQGPRLPDLQRWDFRADDGTDGLHGLHGWNILGQCRSQPGQHVRPVQRWHVLQHDGRLCGQRLHAMPGWDLWRDGWG